MAEPRYLVAVVIALGAAGAFVVSWRALSSAPVAVTPAPAPPEGAPEPPRPRRHLPGPPDGPLGEEPRDAGRR